MDKNNMFMFLYMGCLEENKFMFKMFFYFGFFLYFFILFMFYFLVMYLFGLYLGMFW